MREDADLMSQPPTSRGPRWFPQPIDLLADAAGLAAFVDQAFDGLCTYAEGAIRKPNARMAELLATGEDDLEGAALLDQVSPGYRERVSRALARRGGSFEVELMRHDGLRVAVTLLVWHPAAASGDVRMIALRRIEEAAPPTPATLVAAGAASRWQVALEQMDGCSLTVDQSGFVLDCLLPREHRVASLFKRWLLGTHQGTLSREQLDSYLEEFTFRFNRRTSRNRWKLFYRLVAQAVAVEPAPYSRLVTGIS